MRYAIVIEKAEASFAAYVPDLPGCVATGATVEEVEQNIREAIGLHLAGLREDASPFRPHRAPWSTSTSRHERASRRHATQDRPWDAAEYLKQFAARLGKPAKIELTRQVGAWARPRRSQSSAAVAKPDQRRFGAPITARCSMPARLLTVNANTICSNPWPPTSASDYVCDERR